MAGLSQSAKNGAIIKGGGILELLSRTETVLIDKTGTLTHGALGVTSASQGAVAQEAIDVIAILWALTTLKKITFEI